VTSERNTVLDPVALEARPRDQPTS
jgi:hypothetical protein